MSAIIPRVIRSVVAVDWPRTADEVYVVALLVTGAARVALMLKFVSVCHGQPMEEGSGSWKAFWLSWRAGATRSETDQARWLGAFQSSQGLALTVGSLGLAAWSILEAFAVPHRAPALSLNLLFIGVLLCMLGPLTFRLEGAEGSQLGLDSCVSVGYIAIVLSLACLMPTFLGHEDLAIAGIGMAVIVGGRELVECRGLWRLSGG